ncbi:acyltransferase family protein [Chamaesiphon polymorphus]|uniref:Acyltransferase 3 domain-containing protein n=1 Tax=Chamaesiphon polymorphus CCALA 037 TaxID=2107692 RepID=A0A2T1GMV7_9CYAN|nr:acyltransferase [Chamaesiphon polymorphus]PSB59248.1 hypothetical protein C7B77_01735 [Chamaesiphon polymorphus CCALA 037]
MNKKLLGVEICRGLSTYAVILVHSGDETWGIPIDPIAIAFRSHFYFAVPFFLATAFYFMTAKVDIVYSEKFWRSRIERILVPYTIWSIIFVISRVIVFSLTNKTDRLQQLLQDPISIIFFGGASYHLYFLTLLFAGTLLVLLLPILENLKTNKYVLIFLSIVSTCLYYALESSGNSFQLGANIAFQNLLNSWQIDWSQFPLLRVISVEIAWTIKCLPYFFIGLILNRYDRLIKIPSERRLIIVVLSLLLFGANKLEYLLLPGILTEIFLAYILLIVSIYLSDYLNSNIISELAASIGACSFGIYLIHPFIMSVAKFFVAKVISPELTNSISIASMLVLSLTCFFASWLAIYSIKNKPIAKYLLGN